MITNRKLFGGTLVVLLAGFAFWFSTTLNNTNRPAYDGIYNGRLYCVHAKNIALTLAIKGDRYKLTMRYLDDGDVDSLHDEGSLVYRGNIIEIGRGSNMYYHVTEHGMLRQMDRQAKEFMTEEYTLKKV